jgi:hypothetical protein
VNDGIQTRIAPFTACLYGLDGLSKRTCGLMKRLDIQNITETSVALEKQEKALCRSPELPAERTECNIVRCSGRSATFSDDRKAEWVIVPGRNAVLRH